MTVVSDGDGKIHLLTCILFYRYLESLSLIHDCINRKARKLGSRPD